MNGIKYIGAPEHVDEIVNFKRMAQSQNAKVLVAKEYPGVYMDGTHYSRMLNALKILKTNTSKLRLMLSGLIDRSIWAQNSAESMYRQFSNQLKASRSSFFDYNIKN